MFGAHQDMPHPEQGSWIASDGGAREVSMSRRSKGLAGVS